MTGNNKTRALILSALMVLSVFAGTIALSGTAAASNHTTEFVSAVEFEQGNSTVTIDNGSDNADGGEVEVAWDNTAFNNVDYEIYANGAKVGQGSDTVADGNYVFGDSMFGGDLSPIDTWKINMTVSNGSGGSTHANLTVQATTDTLEEDDSNLTGTDSVFAGAPLAFVADDSTDQSFDVFKGSTFQASRSTGENSNVFYFPTNGKTTDELWQFKTGDGSIESVELRTLGLSVTTGATNLTTNNDVAVDVSSNAANRDVVLQLVDSGGDVAGTQVVTLDGSGEASYNFGSQTQGSYTVFATDVATANQDSTSSISVSKVTKNAAFATNVVTEERGDVATITVLLTGGAETATVSIGSDDVNFQLNATVTDGNGDGEVTLVWDTSQSATNATGGVRAVAGSADSVNVNSTGGKITDPVSSMVETGEYPVAVDVVGDSSAEDLATFIIESRSDTALTSHTAPNGLNYTAASSAEQGNTIAINGANGDEVILRLAASGIEGAVGTNSSNLQGGTYSLTIREDSSTVGVNEDPIVFNISTASMVSPEDDVYFIRFNAASLNGEVGDKFNVLWDSDGVKPGAGGSYELTASFELVQGAASFDRQANKVFVEASENAEVTGTSTWAPGTSLEIRLKSSGGTSPFVKTNDTITVTEEGTWSAGFDLSDQADGQSFTARIIPASGGGESGVEGEIGTLSAAVTFDDQQAADSGTLVTVSSVTLSNAGFVAIHQESASGPIVGVSSYLEAGSHSDVQIRLTEAVSSETTLVAMAHKDTDQDKTFDFVASEGADDGPYTSGGAAVTDDAAVTIPTPTPTATEPPTDTPTDTETEMDDTPTDTEVDDDTPTPTPTPTTSPGFGLIVALLALAGAALLAIRRE